MSDAEPETGPSFHPVSRTAVVLVALATCFWTIYPQLTQLNLDTYLDMLENHVWGIRWQWGNSKHPPLFGWLTASWFTVFPRTELSYRVLAALNIGVTLLIMIAIARRFVAPAGQAAAVMAALAMPPLGFLAFTYNANSAMLPFWAATILFYLRVVERPRALDAALLGLFAAAAILSKYFAAVLLITLLAHALSYRQTRAILASRLTVIVALVFAGLLTPHLIWLIDNGFSPIVFAARGQGDASAAAQAYRQVEFALAQLLYALPGIGMLALLRRPGDGEPLVGAGMREPVSCRRAVLLWAGLGAVPVAMLLALLAQSPLTSNWSIPIFSVVPILAVLFLLPTGVAEKMRGWTVGLSIGFMAVMLALSPVIRSHLLAEARMNNATPLRAMAEAAGALWAETIDAPVGYVAGHSFPAYAASFYLPGRPQVLDGRDLSDQPWVRPEVLGEMGAMVVCLDPNCIAPWQDSPGWQTEALGQADVPAIAGAGGPASYSVHVWRAVPTENARGEQIR